MATKSEVDRLMHGVGGELRASERRISLSLGKEALHDRESKRISKPHHNPYGFTGLSRPPGQQRTVAPVKTGGIPHNKRKRESTNINIPPEPSYKKFRTSVAFPSTARGSNVASGVEGLLLGQDIVSDATKTQNLSSSMSGNRLKNLLEGREPSASWHSEMSSDADELAFFQRATGKQRGEAGGPNDCIVDLGKPKPNPRNRTPSGSTAFDPIGDRVRQFEQEAVRPFPHRDQHAQPPRTRKIPDMRGKARPQRNDLFGDPFISAHFTSKANNSQKPMPQRDPGEEITVECRIPVELWYLGQQRKVPEIEVEGTKASLQWEATGKIDRLIVTIESGKTGSETFRINIDDLELWAPIKEGRCALFVFKGNSPFYRQHKQQGSFAEYGDDFDRAMFFRFSTEEWEREKDSLVAFLTKVKENNAYGKKRVKEYEDLFKKKAIDAAKRKGESSLSLSSHTPEPSTPTLADMESSSPPPARLSTGRKHAREQVATIPRPTRQTRSAAQRENTTRRKELDEVILAYPFTGIGGIEITKSDLNRLKPGEFLNDTLVEFSLKHWLQELKETNAELADEVHVFSTFFYKRLKTGTLQQGYANVRKWTSKVDIFKKKYLIVPINEHLHWYLAIILFPGNVLTGARRPVPALRRSGRYDKSGAATVSSRSTEIVSETSNIGSPATSNAMLPPESNLGSESADEMEQSKHHQGPVEVNGTPRTTLQKINGYSVDTIMEDVEASLPLDAMNQTWIMTFDSLGGNHQMAIESLRAYLRAEALDKQRVDLENKRPARGKTVPTPEQPNSCDCGVYVGQVVETIFKSPAEFWQLAFSRSQKNRLTGNHPLWDVERFKKKRNELHNLITRLSEQWKEVRGKTALAPLPDSSTLPAFEATAKEDKDAQLLMPNKRKSRSMEPIGDPDEDEVIIVERPAAKRQQRSPHKKTGSTPRKGTGGATRPRRYS